MTHAESLLSFSVAAGDPSGSVEVRRALAVLGAHGPVHVLQEGGLLVAWVGSGEGVESATRWDLQVQAAQLEDRVTPPHGRATRSGRALTLSVDYLGFRHAYVASGPDWAAVSTSATALSVLGGHGLDEGTVAVQSLLGWQLGTRTLFDGVAKLGPGVSAVVEDGVVRVNGTSPLLGDLDPVGGTMDAAVERASEIVVARVTEVLDHVPGILLQLTGGLDSRILLAAVPAHRRRDLTCLTLAVPGSPDAELAAELCRRHRMQHVVLPLDAVDRLTPAETGSVVRAAARDLDAGADPLALAALRTVEGDLAGTPRLSGLGGEVVRGFYYLPRVLEGRDRDARIRRLAQWRLFPNEGVPDEFMHPRVRGHRKETALQAVREIFAESSADWSVATDQFYLWQRMQRWAGLLASARASERVVVNPMLDQDFLELGMRLPAEWKAGMQFLSRILVRLDPDLADLPLDGRPAPAVYAHPGARQRLLVAGLTARKAWGKARQRFTATGRPAAGGAGVADRLVQTWREEPGVLDRVRELELVSPTALDAMLSGDPVPESGVVLTANLVAATPVTGG